jgi:hypothetical protein
MILFKKWHYDKFYAVHKNMHRIRHYRKSTYTETDIRRLSQITDAHELELVRT